MSEYLYRYTDEMRCGVVPTEGGGEDCYTTGPHLSLSKYRIIKRTPCGAWIDTGFGFDNPPYSKRFVNLQSTKQFACETVEQALVSFRARKRKQVYILKAQLQRAEKALTLEPNQPKPA